MHLSEKEYAIIKIDDQRHNYPNLINDELESMRHSQFQQTQQQSHQMIVIMLQLFKNKQ